MRTLPYWKLYKECPQCKEWAFGQFDIYCTRCGHKLKDHDEWLAGIRDYAKSILIEYLEKHPDWALKDYIDDIPDEATKEITLYGSIIFNQRAARHVLAECWNEVETALDDWRDTNGIYFQVKNIDQLHIFAVTQHAKMVWREIIDGFDDGHLDEEMIAEVVERLKLL